MELLTGLAVGWQQQLHSVKMPKTKGRAPRPCRVTAKPRLWGFQTPLPREQEGESLLRAFPTVSGHPPLPPPTRTKTRMERCQGDAKQAG